MARMDTRNATAMPTTSRESSAAVKAKPNFTIFRRLAPNITGIPRKKLNSAATLLEAPRRMPPRIVAPEREVPGISDRTWKMPIPMAGDQVMSLRELMRGFLPRLWFSTRMNRIP